MFIEGIIPYPRKTDFRGRFNDETRGNVADFSHVREVRPLRTTFQVEDANVLVMYWDEKSHNALKMYRDDRLDNLIYPCVPSLSPR
jgi:hypothetical protein